MKYTHLGPEQEEQILVGRIQQLEAEHFNHTLNVESLQDATDLTDDQREQHIVNAERAMETIDRAHAQATSKLAEVRERQRGATGAGRPRRSNGGGRKRS